MCGCVGGRGRKGGSFWKWLMNELQIILVYYIRGEENEVIIKELKGGKND